MKLNEGKEHGIYEMNKESQGKIFEKMKQKKSITEEGYGKEKLTTRIC